MVKIPVTTNPKLISEEKARQKAKSKLKAMDVNNIKTQLCYKKMYFLRVMTYASRVPFKPKKRPYVIFFDAYLGLGGLTYGVPEFEKISVPEDTVVPDAITLESVEGRKNQLIERHVLKQYLLKRPEVVVEGIDEIYLPYYRCMLLDKEVFINAATGKASL